MIIVPGTGVGLVGDGGNNEVATFTDDRHVQGEANLTFDGSTLTVDGNMTVTMALFFRLQGLVM